MENKKQKQPKKTTKAAASIGSHPFVSGLRDGGLAVSETLESRLDWNWVEAFADFLKNFNEAGGFFSRNDSERILERHIYENLVLLDYVASRENVSRETSVADAGSGPGLPGFLFGCMKERPEVTLIDSSRRRLGLLETEFQAGLGLITKENVTSFPKEEWPRLQFRYERLEEVRHLFDLVVIRALIPLPFCIEVICKMQRVGSKTYLSTTPEAFAKPSVADRVAELGYVSRETYVPKEIEFLGSRAFVCLEKTGKPTSRYPRAWKIIQQEMTTWKESTQ